MDVIDGQLTLEDTSIIGLYYGRDATVTEKASGEQIEVENRGPLKPGKPGHLVLQVFADGGRYTAYDASKMVCGDYHALRRETPRLAARKYVEKDGYLPNHAPRGRPNVDAYRITVVGLGELRRLEHEVD